MFSGYRRAINETNKYRDLNNLPKIQNIYCNAHARRKFKEAKENYPDEAEYFIEHYKKIYRLERIAQKRPPGRRLRARKYMRSIFEEMKQRATENIAGYSTKSKIGQAMSYLLKNYEEFIYFIDHEDLPAGSGVNRPLILF